MPLQTREDNCSPRGRKQNNNPRKQCTGENYFSGLNRRNMEFTSRTKYLITFALLAVIIVLIFFFRHVLLPFMLGSLLAYIMSPIVDWMTKKKIGNFPIPRGLAIIVIYLFFLTAMIFGGGYFLKNLSVEIEILIKTIPEYAERTTQEWLPAMQKKLRIFTELFPKIEPDETELKRIKKEQPPTKKIPHEQEQTKMDVAQFLANTRFEVKQTQTGYEIIPRPHKKIDENNKERFDINLMFTEAIENLVRKIKDDIVDLLNLGRKAVFSILDSLFMTMVTLMISAFLVIDSKGIIRYIRGLFPNYLRSSFEKFLKKLDTGLNGVVRGQLIICLVNGTLTGIGLVLLDIKFALILSIFATISSLIPIFGVIISSIPIILMALTNSLMTAFLALCWVLGIHFIEGNLLNPKIMGKSAEIHPVLIIFALFAGEKTYGIFGALLAVPIFSVLQTTFVFILENILAPQTPELVVSDRNRNQPEK